ncbi:MAG: RNA-binding protein [Firmicutes bacterium]|nr:RNA-binding protein [Bacillota bacterium]
MTREEQILSATIQDKCRLAEKRGIPMHTGFLTPAEANFAEAVCRAEGVFPAGRGGSGTEYLLDGGYEDADRRICVLFPSGPDGFRTEESPEPSDRFLCVLKVSVPKGSKPLTHRDYLGSLLGLGVERSVAGDILVRENGADIIVLRDMADYLAQNLTSVGRAQVSVSVAELSELDLGQQRTEEYRDTVASLRLDSVAASAFRLARGKAQDAIRAGLVSVNGRQVEKPDAELSEGDRISLRGKGKAVLSEAGGRTRKDRIAVVITRYL